MMKRIRAWWRRPAPQTAVEVDVEILQQLTPAMAQQLAGQMSLFLRRPVHIQFDAAGKVVSLRVLNQRIP